MIVMTYDLFSFELLIFILTTCVNDPILYIHEYPFCRLDADIPVPYGRTVIKPQPTPVQLVLNKRKDVLIAVLGSNCGGKNKRWDYIRELQKYITVHVYGGCGKFKT